MRSIDHHGFLFDNLTFSNFGYGGDPNNVSRMRIEKNKWYDFRLLFRRDKNFWDYNLFANPLNPAALNPAGSLTTGCYVGPVTKAFPQGAPAYCSNPAVAQNNSLHSWISSAPHAGLRPHAAADLQSAIPIGLFA